MWRPVCSVGTREVCERRQSKPGRPLQFNPLWPHFVRHPAKTASDCSARSASTVAQAEGSRTDRVVCAQRLWHLIPARTQQQEERRPDSQSQSRRSVRNRRPCAPLVLGNEPDRQNTANHAHFSPDLVSPRHNIIIEQ